MAWDLAMETRLEKSHFKETRFGTPGNDELVKLSSKIARVMTQATFSTLSIYKEVWESSRCDIIMARDYVHL